MHPARNYRCTLRGEHLPTRIDRALVVAFPALSRRRIRRALDGGSIYLNRHRVRVASRLVFSGDAVEIFLPAALPPMPQLCHDDIIYRDARLLVVNKPPGLLSQATRTQAVAHLTVALHKLLPACGQLHLVHRLDQETSGAMVVARNRHAAVFLSQQFRARRVEKEYLALCYGTPTWHKHEERSHLLPIAKNLGTVATARCRHPHTRTAVTRFTVIATSPLHPVTLLRCEPHSGRSHQLRVQLQHLKLPLLGDKKYGYTRPQLPPDITALTSEHHLLHAHRLSLQPAAHRARITAQAKIPPNFNKLLKILSIAAQGKF